MTRRRRSSALRPGNLCTSARQSQAYPNYNQYYGPPPAPLSPSYPQPVHHPTPSTSRNPIISPEDDIQRLFNVCKVGRNNAELLQEVLVYAKPQELRNDITKELLGRARASQDLIGSQIAWATSEAEKSRRAALVVTETTEEQLLAALLVAHEQLTECLRMYEDLDRIAIEQEAEERLKTERLIQALTAVAEFNATPEEDSLVNWVMSIGDPDTTGKINPQTATRIFSASNLAPDALARIWEIASVDSKDGLLDRQGVGVALRLIGHAQKGETVTEALVNRPGPIAIIDSPSSPLANESTAGSSLGAASNSLPPLTSHDRAKFRKIFKGSGAENGYLGGQQAREVFMKSKLPWNTLSQIWELADRQRRGCLDLPDFTVAMYLIQALMTGRLASIPSSLPPQLYEDATHHSRSPSPAARHASTPLHHLPPPPPLHPSRASPPHPLPPLTSSPFSGVPPPRHPSRGPSQPSSPRWEVTPAIRVQAEHIFSSLDPRSRGCVRGDAVHAYLRQGYLTRDEFSAALLLMKSRKDGHHLPTTLPPGLLPTQPPAQHDDAYDGIAPDNSTPPHARPPALRIVSHIETGTGGLTPGPPNIRTSRSTPQLGDSSMFNPPASPFSTAPSSPFPASPHNPSTSYLPVPAASPSDLNITHEERTRYDRFFDQLDTQRKGYLLSDIAVPFFARARLPNEVMATIWDLADSEHDGRLTKDDFAVAMYLIRQKLAGKELPTTVPASLLASSSAASPSPSPQLQRQASRPVSQETPQPPTRPASDAQVEPAMTPLPDDLDEDLPRSDTPPPPYELIATSPL